MIFSDEMSKVRIDSMANQLEHKFTIEEVRSGETPYLPGMNAWLEQIFPEYCPPRFHRLLAKHRHPDGRHQIQIFVGITENQVAGLVQILHQEWQGGLLTDIDLLGVLEPFRRSGMALALVQRSLLAHLEMAGQILLPAIGIGTLIDPHDPAINRLHQKLGGQIRSDHPFWSGDVIVWYPSQPEFEAVPTATLCDRFRLFGQLLADER